MVCGTTVTDRSRFGEEEAVGANRGMLPPLVFYAPTEFLRSRKILLRKWASERNCFAMPAVKLTTGVTLITEDVKWGVYYPCGSIRSGAHLDRGSARHAHDFLYIRTANGPAHVRGTGASQDATALEQAGVCVYRRPQTTARGDS